MTPTSGRPPRSENPSKGMRGATGAGAPDLLTPAEVGALFRVDPKTVNRWASTGRIRGHRTPGGGFRFVAADIMALLPEGYRP